MLELLKEYQSSWISGIEITLLLTVGGVIFGGLLALFLTILKVLKVPVISKLIDLYLFIIRGTPFLVQLYIIYYGPLQFASISHSMIGPLLQSAYFCAFLTLSLNTSAYTTALFYGAIENLPQGEIIAAEALGMRKLSILIKIILPRMFKRILPAYSNEVLMVLKCTALVSSISIMEIMGTTRQVMSDSYEVIPSLLIAGVIYVIISFLIGISFKWFISRNKYQAA